MGGHKRIQMAEMKQMLTAMGFDTVQTYIQSGNALFQPAEDAPALRRRIEQQILTVFGFDVPVVLRTAEELVQIVANNPFSEAEMQDAQSLAVSLLADSPPAGSVDRLLSQSPASHDEFRVVGRDI